MDPINEMMEKYEVEKDFVKCEGDVGCPSIETSCSECPGAMIGYPPLTSEKQLEIIKMLASNRIGEPHHQFQTDKDEILDEWYLSISFDSNDINVHHKDFTYALALLLVSCYSILTSTKRQEIKRILEE
ncbi:MAG: hypothetical protein NC334_09525 [Bacteroides sp.]|nr:hypothetical protein [Bacteroides sp.]